jgi:RHS repeat-associated protein
MDAVDIEGAVTSLTQADTDQYNLTDNLGSLRIIVNNASAILDEIVYNSPGQVAYESAPSTSHFAGFAGGHTDPYTLLDEFYHRFYDPGTEKWLTPDPADFAAGGDNLTQYVGNDPTGASDPTGLFPEPPHTPTSPSGITLPGGANEPYSGPSPQITVPTSVPLPTAPFAPTSPLGPAPVKPSTPVINVTSLFTPTNYLAPAPSNPAVATAQAAAENQEVLPGMQPPPNGDELQATQGAIKMSQLLPGMTYFESIELEQNALDAKAKFVFQAAKFLTISPTITASQEAITLGAGLNMQLYEKNGFYVSAGAQFNNLWTIGQRNATIFNDCIYLQFMKKFCK